MRQLCRINGVTIFSITRFSTQTSYYEIQNARLESDRNILQSFIKHFLKSNLFTSELLSGGLAETKLDNCIEIHRFIGDINYIEILEMWFIRMLWYIKKMRRLTNILTLLITLTILTSCEGFKVLTIHNTSGYEAKVTVRPGFNYSDKSQINNYPNNQISDSSIVFLQPDSSMTILSIFTGMMFNVKIKEQELRTDYLKIETQTDTTIANSREEIIDLIYSKQKEQVKGEGKNFATLKIE